MPVDVEKPGRSGHVADRGNGAEQDRTVPAVEDREPASLQCRMHVRVDGLHHLQQRALIDEAGEVSPSRFGWGHDDVPAQPRAGQR